MATLNDVFGPSEVRALPLAAGINVSGHYWSERSACASGQHSGGHYFRYFGPRLFVPAEQLR